MAFLIYTKLFFIINFATIVLSACPKEVYARGVTSAEANFIVQKHNNLRSLIMRGAVPNQPKGKNLKIIKWDKAIANAAQNIANTCEFKHVSVHDNRWYVGQNLFLTWGSANSGGPDWNSAIQVWFNEHKDYTYPNGKLSHYTQVVWGNTEYVGCGYIKYLKNGNYYKFYVCNYGPGGNIVGQPPYQKA